MAKDLMVSWLRDADGLEQAKIEVLEHSFKDFQDDAVVKQKLQEYLEVCQEHSAELKQTIEAAGDSASAGKALIGKITALIPSFGTNLYTDTAVKDLLVLHGAAQFARACYVSLAAGAAASDQPKLAERCQQMAQDEVTMAEWLLESIPEVTERELTVSRQD